MAIGGAAVGAFLIANKGNVIKTALKDFGKSFKGPKWKAQDYKDLLCLLFSILKLVRTKGMVALEQHIENPEQSAIFQQYPKILHDHFAVDFICDSLRMITMNFEDPHQLEDMMENSWISTIMSCWPPPVPFRLWPMVFRRLVLWRRCLV